MELVVKAVKVWVCRFFFFQAEDGIRDIGVTGVQTCALPISLLARSPQRVEDALHPEPQLQDQVGGYAVRLRRRPGEHGGEADHRSRGVDGLHALEDGATGHQPLQVGLLGLVEAVESATVYYDDDDASRQWPIPVHHARRLPRILGLPVEERLVYHVARCPHRRREAEHEPRAPEAQRLGDQVLERKERQQRLGHLLQEVSAGRVRVLEDEPPETDEVGPRGARPQVVVQRPPEEDGKEDVEPEGQQHRADIYEAEDEHEQAKKAPERPPELEREVVANEDRNQRNREPDRGQGPSPEAAVQPLRNVQQQEGPQDEDRVERLPLVQDVPRDRKSTRLNSSHANISYAVF